MSLQGHTADCHTSHWVADHNTQEWVAEDGHIIHIPAKAMNVAWGKDGRFWRWNELPSNVQPKEFSKENLCAAELIQVNWLEVKGTLNLAKHEKELSGFKDCEIVYHIKFKIDAFGWAKTPVKFEVVTPDGHREKRSEIMESYRKTSHEWLEIHGGEFKLPKVMKGEVEFSISETESHWWKGGMIFAGASIKPKKKDNTHN